MGRLNFRRKKQAARTSEVRTHRYTTAESDELLRRAAEGERSNLRLSKGQVKLLRMRSS